MRTRRRPIGRDYAAAKDAECGLRPLRAVGSMLYEPEAVGAIGAYALEGCGNELYILLFPFFHFVYHQLG
jgi:hypothetical protein